MKVLRIVVALVMVAAAALLPGNPAAATSDRSDANCGNGYVGLTYDDGPNAGTTRSLLDALRAGGARATFFIWGQHAQQNPNLLRATQAAGMWIANHTMTHAHLTQIGEPAAFNEISGAQQVIRQITGLTPTLFRPPFGETNATVRNDEAQLGVQAAAALRPGGIILMHEGFQTTIRALPQILSGLSSRGLCPGRIVFTPMNISGAGQIFHAIAVAP
jgi:peptidoglycan/xylan/chitin deacetylase (PgdA/CDA1 family)